MPTLRELEGQLLRVAVETTDEKDAEGRYVWRENGEALMWGPTPERTVFHPVDRFDEAHGVRFLCPKSFAKNGGPKGTHSVYIFFANSPYAGRNTAGQEVRWSAGGTCLDDLVLTPSIQEQDESLPIERQCNWHGFVGSNGVPAGHAA